MKQEISGGLVHELPTDLAESLREHNVVSIWESISVLVRNEYICWIEDAKQEKTRLK